MKLTFTSILLSFFALGIFISPVQAQEQKPLDIALRYLEQNREKWKLSETDTKNPLVSDQYQTRHNGLHHLYFIQRYHGIEVFNSIAGIHILANGKVAHATSRFIPNIGQAVNTTTPTLTAAEAVRLAAIHLGSNPDTPLKSLAHEENRYIFAGANIADSPIKAKLCYQPIPATGAVRLAWSLEIDQQGTADYWSIRVDAVSGEILDQYNRTVYCQFAKEENHGHGLDCGAGFDALADEFQPLTEALLHNNETVNDGANYRVFPLPVESPLHGARALVFNPADPIASPFGWHDVNGQSGPEYRITRGNNTHAHLDLQDTNLSNNDEPNGGADLLFDFPFDDQNQEPEQYREAAVTQLFYTVNMMHDFAYQYGFDEAAGNFQETNYNGEGEENDPVSAHAQDGANNDNLNNANFTTLPDGVNGRMQMFLWNMVGGQITIKEPSAIAGVLETSDADFGPDVTDVPVEGEVVVAFDNSNNPNLVCEAVVNTDEINGKIALIDRGICTFQSKTLAAEAAGAIAVIICNYEDSFVSMGEAGGLPDPAIPALMLKASDCAQIKLKLNQGETVVASFQDPEGSGPEQLDGDFDNGIIAHEYGHGISGRLTGGPANVDCLNNDEQMGEGWSDFFTLVTTAKPGDIGAKPRGVGNYVIRRDIEATGLRRQPYSTDWAANNQTYYDVIGTTSPHNLGEIWAATLWDIYWKFVDLYGFDEDLLHGAGGNNMAIQLVMDGMKLQPCIPGMVDGRDALLKADSIDFAGAHQCLLWEVFARRGLGWDADQGTAFDRNDGIESYDTRPDCVKELKISKTTTPLIEAGDVIYDTIIVTNHKETTLTGITVTEPLPAGATFIPGSSSLPDATTQTGDLVFFEVGELTPGQSVTIIYQLQSSANLFSIRQFLDDMENGEDQWFFDNLDEGVNIWEMQSGVANSGQHAWFVQNAAAENDQVLTLLDPILITGAQPVLRFYHRYNTEPAYDAGIIQLSTDGGNTWENVDENAFFRGAYRGPVAYGAFAIPYLQGFWGNSQDFVASYLDLSEYVGEQLLVRFRFGSDLEVAAEGWYVDDVEFMDLFNYQSETCVSSGEGDQACATAPGRGTVVESAIASAIEAPGALARQVRLYPNPANEEVTIELEAIRSGRLTIRVFSPDGRSLLQQQNDLTTGVQFVSLDVAALPVGFYLVRLETEGEVITRKLVVE